MTKVPQAISEGRRLTAAWLNIMAAGFVSAGTIPVLTAASLEGWSERTRALSLLPLIAFGVGLSLHTIGRVVVRDVSKRQLDPSRREITYDKVPPQAYPVEADVDQILEEYGGDARTVIKALLHDLDQFASDRDRSVSFAGRDSTLKRRA